ncbi:uncharacterized protein LOC123316340 [Coccinella septempunctata]|uniref:uncharacterized protein LOC123316340 n=1 Tax=Coccinella septempunctata TaxID=41139 RepID=UPI001D075819|nr:uncharacterized protein LOC123316340 [Coccinella septempunctata]
MASILDKNYMSSDSGLNVCMPFWESAEKNTFEYFYSDSYRQNIDISRVSISRGHSRCSHREKTKCECSGEDDQQTSTNDEGRRKAYKPKSQKKTSRTSEAPRNNCDGPKVAIQFDLNKLLEEIAKSDKKTCALCGKPKKNINRDHEYKRDSSPGKMVHLNTRQDGKISFFLNDKLKITIEESSVPPKNKQEKNFVDQQRPNTCPYRKGHKSSIYTATSETYPVKTQNRIPCPSSCPMVKLKQLLIPDDTRMMSCRTGRSETTNTSTQNLKRKRDKSLQTLKTRECSRKKRKGTTTLNAEDVEVTHSGQERKRVTREIVKDGNNVKIIIRVKKTNGTFEEDSEPISTSSNGQDDDQKNPQEAQTQPRTSTSSRKMSTKISKSKYTGKNWCPCKKIATTSTTGYGNSSSKNNKFSTVNIIMSPRSTSKEISNAKDKSEDTNDYTSSEDCWSKLEEFLDRKIKEIRLTDKNKRSSKRKRENMNNKTLNVPSCISVTGCEKKLGRESSTNRRYSRVCFDDEIRKICTGNCGHKKCSQKRSFEEKSNSGSKLSNKPYAQLKTDFIQMKLISHIDKTSKSESSIFDKNTSLQTPEQSKSLCQVKRKSAVEKRQSSIHQGSEENSGKLNLISIQSDLEFSKNLVVKISDFQRK